MDEKQKPKRRYSIGAISASVFENRSTIDGEERTFESVSLQRAYKGKDEKWSHSHSIPVDQIPRAIVVLLGVAIDSVKSSSPDRTDGTQ